MYVKTAIKAVLEAGKEILKIYEKDFTIECKDDKSPLTEADLASNKIILSYLKKTNIPIISEENKLIDYSERKSWKSCWIVDPIDGTKEFIKKNGEFTVNIALVENGETRLGVIFVPAKNELYYTNEHKTAAFKTAITAEKDIEKDLFCDTDRIEPAPTNSQKINVVGSRSHMNQDTLDFVEELKQKGNDVDIVSQGSSLKFCLVAEGKADVYPRFAPTMEWDTAAGQAICEAVGLKVIDQNTQKPMVYNRENLLNNYFLVTK
ncbi:3'(2'),5'-bisphosphate nucleotidase CysQ [Gaetbulibacter aestuarii]|uniref:3'(2'),5'-bisphosphate nucleotidase CysQ n=1 Tax=Gaetbulibacter aestuarii TaxID=1502358 RepID=A0ABW7MW26_9FLAO